MRRRLLSTAVMVVIGALACATVALASGFSRPVLKKPANGRHVHAGVIRLIVKDPGVPKSVRPVYVTISPNRKLDRYGRLRYRPCGGRCDFVALKPWRHHRGYWIYKSQFNFPGYWAVTRGKYYWQAEHTAPLCQAKGCEVASRIHTFTVVG